MRVLHSTRHSRRSIQSSALNARLTHDRAPASDISRSCADTWDRYGWTTWDTNRPTGPPGHHQDTALHPGGVSTDPGHQSPGMTCLVSDPSWIMPSVLTTSSDSGTAACTLLLFAASAVSLVTDGIGKWWLSHIAACGSSAEAVTHDVGITSARMDNQQKTYCESIAWQCRLSAKQQRAADSMGRDVRAPSQRE